MLVLRYRNIIAFKLHQDMKEFKTTPISEEEEKKKGFFRRMFDFPLKIYGDKT